MCFTCDVHVFLRQTAGKPHFSRVSNLYACGSLPKMPAFCVSSCKFLHYFDKIKLQIIVRKNFDKQRKRFDDVIQCFLMRYDLEEYDSNKLPNNWKRQKSTSQVKRNLNRDSSLKKHYSTLLYPNKDQEDRKVFINVATNLSTIRETRQALKTFNFCRVSAGQKHGSSSDRASTTRIFY